MLISQMLQVDVDARFTAEEVLSHPWVTVRAHTHKCVNKHTNYKGRTNFITLVDENNLIYLRVNYTLPLMK